MCQKMCNLEKFRLVFVCCEFWLLVVVAKQSYLYYTDIDRPLYTLIFFTQKVAKTVSSVQPAKLTQFQVMTPAKGVKRSEKLKKGQKIFEGQNKGRMWKKFKFS